MVAQVGYSVAGQSGSQVALCEVCTMHIKTRSASFLVEPQNLGRRFCQWFGLKTIETVSPGLASKLVATVSPSLASKSMVEDFLVWVSKPAAMVW
jgi:hypothetical protein